jgi:peptide/nickel transport system substrate-binding protein
MQKFTDLVPAETVEKFIRPYPDKAVEILISRGYEKSDKYWMKDGEELGLEIQVFEGISELERIADVYAEQLQRFGINAVMVRLTGGTWSDNLATGNYEAQSGWQTCGSIIEPWNTLRQLRSDRIAPIGERFQLPQTNRFRWHHAEYSEIVDEISRLDWDDPELFRLTARALEIYYDELPVIPTAQSKKLVPFNTAYWTNWPTQDHYYQRPVTWCPSFIGVLSEIRQVGR